MSYIYFSILAAIGFGFYNFFVGKSGGKISPFLATLFLSLSAASVALVVLLVQKVMGGEVKASSEGLRLACLAGVATGIAEIFYFFSFSKNSNISVVLPIVFTMTVVTGILLGVIFNHESLTFLKMIGTVFSLMGLFLLAR
jgi:uncharacterized membrane protein